jgi:hypothetical protein
MFIICYVCRAAADGIFEPLDGEGTTKSYLTAGGVPWGFAQLSLQLGSRAFQSDDRPFKLGLIHDGGLDTSWISGKHFLKNGKLNWGVGFNLESSIYLPLHYSFGFDFKFGAFNRMGSGFGAGLNLPVIKDLMWLQIKSDIMFAMGSAALGSFSDDYVLIDGKTIKTCEAATSMAYLFARPELNGYYRIGKQMLLMAGTGFQLPFWSGFDFNFKSKSGFLDFIFGIEKEEVTLETNSSSVIFELDGKKVSSINVSAKGFIFNAAVVFESNW